MASTSISTACPSCGAVALDPDEVLLVLPADGTAWYRFDCRGCARSAVHDAPQAAVDLLTRAGARILAVPAEVGERRERPGPCLDADAVLDALALLASPADLVALARSGR